MVNWYIYEFTFWPCLLYVTASLWFITIIYYLPHDNVIYTKERALVLSKTWKYLFSTTCKYFEVLLIQTSIFSGSTKKDKWVGTNRNLDSPYTKDLCWNQNKREHWYTMKTTTTFKYSKFVSPGKKSKYIKKKCVQFTPKSQKRCHFGSAKQTPHRSAKKKLESKRLGQLRVMMMKMSVKQTQATSLMIQLKDWSSLWKKASVQQNPFLINFFIIH